MKLSRKAENIIKRVRSMTDDEIDSYLSGNNCPPHVRRVYDWWSKSGMVVPHRTAFAMSILAFDCNKSYDEAALHWRELDVDYYELAYIGVALEDARKRSVILEVRA